MDATNVKIKRVKLWVRCDSFSDRSNYPVLVVGGIEYQMYGSHSHIQSIVYHDEVGDEHDSWTGQFYKRYATQTSEEWVDITFQTPLVTTSSNAYMYFGTTGEYLNIRHVEMYGEVQ